MPRIAALASFALCCVLVAAGCGGTSQVVCSPECPAGTTCTADGSDCGNGLGSCAKGSCGGGSCGAIGQPCCGMFGLCTAPKSGCSGQFGQMNRMCVTCGAAGQPCCNGQCDRGNCDFIRNMCP